MSEKTTNSETTELLKKLLDVVSEKETARYADNRTINISRSISAKELESLIGPETFAPLSGL